MKRSDRTIFIVLPVIALAAAYWMLVLSPKREEASKLDDEVAALEAEVAQAEQTAETAEQARENFDEDYQRVVTLGKAVPEDDDTASLITQISGVAEDAHVDFRSLLLADGGGEAPPPEAPAPAEVAPSTESVDTPAPAPVATEAAAAALPIGATVGPAGLPVMPYELQFQGNFFQIADFVAGLDKGVTADKNGEVSVDSRLMTVDGFSLTRDLEKGFPSLLADFAVTTYVTPTGEGLTAGATSSGPAPVSAPAPGETAVDTTSATATEAQPAP